MSSQIGPNSQQQGYLFTNDWSGRSEPPRHPPDPVLKGSHMSKPDTGLNTPVPFLLATGTGVTFLGTPLDYVAPFIPHTLGRFAYDPEIHTAS